MILKSIWKKVLNFLLAPYTLFWYLNKRLSKNSLRKTSIQISSNQPHLCIMHQSYSLRRRMVYYTSVLTSTVLNASPKRIIIHSCSSLIYWTYLTKLGFIQRQIFEIDLCHAYHLVCTVNGDEWKTAFRTCYGLFKWSIMSFGLTDASVAFQQFMNNIFSDFLDVCVAIYLDDILIYSDNMSEHHWYVKEVLKHLCKASPYAKVEKYKFYSESVEYLGYILSSSGLTMSNNKVKIIQDQPEPKKVKDIQSFLGFTNFYHQFIFNYLDIVIPLTCLTQKNIPWKFDSSYHNAFNSLKKAFTSTLILTHWVPNTQLIVETDASDYALAVILSIVNEENEVHLIA